MESNWRYNVYALGLSYGPWSLIARSEGGSPLWLCRRDEANPTMYDVIFIPAPGQLPTIVLPFTIPEENPHFPYGLLVLPDDVEHL